MTRRSCRPFRLNHAGGGGGPSPVTAREFEIQADQVVAAQASALITGQTLAFGMVGSLLGGGTWRDQAGALVTPTGQCTCVGSSDSVTAALDGVNRLLAASNFVWANAGTAHSWIVLEKTTGGQFCFDLSNSSFVTATIMFSPGGLFVGGSTTARPTATDEVPCASQLGGAPTTNTSWGASSGNVPTTYHVVRSRNGEHISVILCRNGNAITLWLTDVIANPVTGITPEFLGCVVSSTTSPATSQLGTNMFNVAFMAGRTSGGAAIVLQPTTEASSTARLPVNTTYDQVNDLNGLFTLYPWGLGCPTVGSIGRHGRVADVFTGIQNLTDGSWYGAAAGTYTYVQFGYYVVPWDSVTAPTLSGGAPVYIGDYYVAEMLA